jgi:hypothetical protein
MMIFGMNLMKKQRDETDSSRMVCRTSNAIRNIKSKR